MKLKDIPVVTIGPGSQPAEGDGARLEYIAMPRDMSTYQRPDVPGPDVIIDLQGAREAMAWLQDALDNYDADAPPAAANLSYLDARNRDLVNQILGEGEVSIRYIGALRASIQESVLAGVWRSLYLDEEDRITHDMVEIGPVPGLVRNSNNRTGVPVSELAHGGAPAGVMNAMSILTELAAQCKEYRRGQTADRKSVV